jgi:hypothetical protein
MATIESGGTVSHQVFKSQIAAMDDSALVAQDLVQQGAIHAASYILKAGCTEAEIADMIASLRVNSSLIREEVARRGKPSLFPQDQTGFN